MPKTPIHKNRRPILPHHDVGFPRYTLHAEAVAVAVVPQPLPHALFGRSVLTADARHTVVALLGCHRVGHCLLAGVVLFRFLSFFPLSRGSLPADSRWHLP